MGTRMWRWLAALSTFSCSFKRQNQKNIRLNVNKIFGILELLNIYQWSNSDGTIQLYLAFQLLSDAIVNKK